MFRSCVYVPGTQALRLPYYSALEMSRLQREDMPGDTVNKVCPVVVTQKVRPVRSHSEPGQESQTGGRLTHPPLELRGMLNQDSVGKW